MTEETKVKEDPDPVDYGYMSMLAGTISKCNNWELYGGDSGFPLPTKMLSLFVCNPHDPVQQDKQPVRTNKDGAGCQLWFSIWEEFEGLDQVDVSYPIHPQPGDPIHVLVQYNDQTLNCPWVHGQPGLADRVLMPLILAASLDSCANHENHSHRLHTSDDDESEPDEMDDDRKPVEIDDDDRGLIATGYHELAKWLTRQQFDVYCRFLKPSNVSLVDCYQKLAQLEEIDN